MLVVNATANSTLLSYLTDIIDLWAGVLQLPAVAATAVLH
jgi:hypothetical protein